MCEAGHSNELLTLWEADAITSTVASIARPRSSAAASDRMINYTDQITRLMHDLISRVPDLQYIDMSRVLVFARFGRSEAEGAYATCHALSLPSSEPSYYSGATAAPGA
jgi:hypothetical protein